MDPEINPAYFENFIPATISLIVTGLASVIIGIYFEKFRTKLTYLKYKLFFQPLATTSQNDYWGEITVQHEKRIVNHLAFVTVQIENDSNLDLEKLNVDIRVDSDSQFLGVSGFFNDTKNAVLLEDNHFAYYRNVLERNMQDMNVGKVDPNHITPPQLMNEIHFISTNKKFHLPVFNRHSSITLHLLIENFKALKPDVIVSVLHKSTKLILESDEATERKRSNMWTLILGIVIYCTGFSIFLRFYDGDIFPLVLFAILGLTYLFIGLYIYKLGLYVKRFLS